MHSSKSKRPPSLPPLYLRKGEERRLRAGHLWIFSNEIDTARSPLSELEPGQPVEIRAANDKVLGGGYANPHSLICARVVDRGSGYHLLDRSLLVHRLNIALSLRERVFAQPFYRLVYGEADGLPGLIVDRFGSVLVVQISTAGMERLREQILAALEKVVRPEAILLRNDAAVRELEGLPLYVEPALGDPPDGVRLEENGSRFEAPLSGGQKTGWYYDHRDNRVRLGRYVAGRRVLDVFSYLGAWGIQAAAAGADQVLCVDSSRLTEEWVLRNAALNDVESRVSALQADAFEALKELREAGERFDLVILDPPAFIKRKRDHKSGLDAYRRLNQAALRLLSADGMLVSASCSFHLQREELRRLLAHGARHVDRTLSIVEQGHQGPDHPIHPAIPETEYLKALFCRVLTP